MLFNKISENPRKGFLQLLAQGMYKIKKTIFFFFELHITQASFALCHGILLATRSGDAVFLGPT